MQSFSLYWDICKICEIAHTLRYSSRLPMKSLSRLGPPLVLDEVNFKFALSNILSDTYSTRQYAMFM